MFLVLCVYGISVCAQTCTSVSRCFLSFFFGSFSSFCLFSLFVSPYSSLVLYYFYFLDVCYLIRERKGMDLGGRGKHNQNIVHEKNKEKRDDAR